MPRFAATFVDGDVEWSVLVTADTEDDARTAGLDQADALAHEDGGHTFTAEHLARIETAGDYEERRRVESRAARIAELRSYGRLFPAEADELHQLEVQLHREGGST